MTPRSRLLALAAPLVAWLALAGPLWAQAGSGVVGASAQLLADPLNAAGIQDLTLGTASIGDVIDVPPGPAAMGATRASAGWLFGNVRKNSSVSLALLLPPALFRGGASIPLDWDNAGYGTLCVARTGDPCQVSGSFNPGSGSTVVVLPKNLQGNNLDLTVYVGTRAVVPAVPAGVYTSSVTLTMTYLN